MMLLFTGDLTAAGDLVDEQQGGDRGDRRQSRAVCSHAHWRRCVAGRRRRSTLIEKTAREVPQRGEGIAMAVAEWTRAVLHNGLGDYPEAMAAAELASTTRNTPTSDIRA